MSRREDVVRALKAPSCSLSTDLQICIGCLVDQLRRERILPPIMKEQKQGDDDKGSKIVCHHLFSIRVTKLICAFSFIACFYFLFFIKD